MIVAQVVTDSNVNHAVTGLTLIDQVEGDIARFAADAAYDTIAIYDAAWRQSASFVARRACTHV